MPDPWFRASDARQTANSGLLEGKQAEAAELRESSDADRVALASGTHLPQQVPTPRSRVRSRMQVAPSLTAARICLSETALQMHTIMRVL
jgi:hypothetical protein